MSGEVNTQFKHETLTDVVLVSPVDRFEQGLRRKVIVGLLAVLILLWLGAIFVF